MPKLIDMKNKRIGRLLVLGIGTSNGTTPRWRCMCDCGNEVLAFGADLRAGKQQSCGCFRSDRSRVLNTIHEKSRSVEAHIWSRMKQRCSNKNDAAFQNYGGRGIHVCERWESSFESFLQDMGPRPSNAHSIDRRDNSKGYAPENCYWATDLEQASNTRRNVYVPDGNESITVMEWCRRHGVHPQTVYNRIRKGQPFDQSGRPGPRSKVTSSSE